MRHLGDITKINGADIPAVDCIVGGSPCQDLSVAGNRAGLDGSRSSLFLEQVRIVKEMREHDRAIGRTGVLVRPRYMVWENVGGSLSSGKEKGADFRRVLEEVARVAQEDAIIPRPPKQGWSYAGCIMGDGWSIAWRLHDAQFWGKTMYVDGRVLVQGTPQRRKRIALVADFGGSTAPEILFERKGLRGNFETEQSPWQETPRDTGKGTDRTIETVAIEGNGTRESHSGDGYKESDVMYTLNGTEQHAVAYGHVFDGSRYHDYKEFDGVMETIKARYGTGGNNTPVVVQGDLDDK